MGPEKTRAEKLFSSSGVVPLGAFVLYHLWMASALLGSHASFDRQSAFLHEGAMGSVFTFLELVLVVLPLVFHAAYGIYLSLQRTTAHSYESDLMRSLERVTGVVILVFVIWHTWQTRVPTLNGAVIAPDYSSRLTEQLSTTSSGIPWTALAYLVGLAATAFHLVAGLNSACVTWSIPATFAGRARARVLFRAIGILFFAVSSATVLELATGTRFFPAEPPSSSGVCGSAAIVATPPPAPSSSASP